MRTKTHVPAFTLIELLLVMVILAVLASVAIPIYISRAEDSRRTTTIAEIKELKTAINAFEVDNGRLPTEREGLYALLQAPADVENSWRGPYLDELPLDKWGHEYHYLYPSNTGYSPFNILSAGKDGLEGTTDDVDIYTKN
jgi:general secretion pathway protein G